MFGGILGDHPPQDRAKEFREGFKHIRQLGTVQMTTDTAVLVSHEIMEGQKNFESLKFVDDPDIPIGASVTRYLDIALPLDKLAEEGCSDLRKLGEHASDFVDAVKSKNASTSAEKKDIDVQETIVMEGFRYRIDDTCFPVMNGGTQCSGFPIIPIGMLGIWREEQQEEGGLDLD